MFIYAFGWEKYATVLPLSVLEGFSFAVGITIGFSQLINAYGLDKVALEIPTHARFYMNVYEVLIRTPDLMWADFSVFLVLVITLMLLSWKLPGRPWIVLISVIGIVYGYVITSYFSDLKPRLLRDMYPEYKTMKGA